MIPRFRAKRIDNGEWHEGFYACTTSGDHCILDLSAIRGEYFNPIDPTTLEIYVAGNWHSDIDAEFERVEEANSKIAHTCSLQTSEIIELKLQIERLKGTEE